VSEKYNHEIGYESLLKDFERYRKQSPRGISLARDRDSILLQFKVGDKSRSKYGCNCSFTLDGMVDALSKAHKVAEALKTFTSEVEFWQWYDKEIRKIGAVKNDVLTFGEAIAKVEQDFWNKPDRRKRKRDKNNPSDKSSWNHTYGRFYKLLNDTSVVNLQDILKAISSQKQGTKTYKGIVSAMKKLCRKINREDVLHELNKLDVFQTEFRDLQSITLDDFLKWRGEILGITASLPANVHLDIRQSWLWAFSMQVVYGLRIHEVFAVQNLDKPFTTKDKKVIPALNDPNNIDNAIVVGEKTAIGTTTKTGYRLARPIIPPTHPDLMELLEIKRPLVPINQPESVNFNSIRTFYIHTATIKLKKWNAPFSQTHALRHLANINGMQAGIPLEVRAQSLGHTPAMNDSTYKKRQSTQTTLDLLFKSNTQAIDFVSGLNEAKRLVADYPDSKQVIAKLIAKIYGKNSDEIIDLL
jgi:hypothetical protein